MIFFIFSPSFSCFSIFKHFLKYFSYFFLFLLSFFSLFLGSPTPFLPLPIFLHFFSLSLSPSSLLSPSFSLYHSLSVPSFPLSLCVLSNAILLLLSSSLSKGQRELAGLRGQREPAGLSFSATTVYYTGISHCYFTIVRI